MVLSHSLIAAGQHEPHVYGLRVKTVKLLAGMHVGSRDNTALLPSPKNVAHAFLKTISLGMGQDGFTQDVISCCRGTVNSYHRVPSRWNGLLSCMLLYVLALCVILSCEKISLCTEESFCSIFSQLNAIVVKYNS